MEAIHNLLSRLKILTLIYVSHISAAHHGLKIAASTPKWWFKRTAQLFKVEMESLILLHTNLTNNYIKYYTWFIYCQIINHIHKIHRHSYVFVWVSYGFHMVSGSSNQWLSTVDDNVFDSLALVTPKNMTILSLTWESPYLEKKSLYWDGALVFHEEECQTLCITSMTRIDGQCKHSFSFISLQCNT